MTLCCPNHQARGIPNRKYFFHCEIFMLRSYNFLHNARPPLGAIAARPRFPLWRGTFFRSPSPPYAHPNSQTLDQRKKTVYFLDKCVHFRKKLHSFFSPRATTLSPSAIPRARRRARSHTHSASFRFLPSPHGDSSTTH